jgi:hypothetical protein
MFQTHLTHHFSSSVQRPSPKKSMPYLTSSYPRPRPHPHPPSAPSPAFTALHQPPLRCYLPSIAPPHNAVRMSKPDVWAVPTPPLRNKTSSQIGAPKPPSKCSSPSSLSDITLKGAQTARGKDPRAAQLGQDRRVAIPPTKGEVGQGQG